MSTIILTRWLVGPAVIVDVPPADLDPDDSVRGPGWGNSPSGCAAIAAAPAAAEGSSRARCLPPQPRGPARASRATDRRMTRKARLADNSDGWNDSDDLGRWVPGFLLGGPWRREAGAGHGVLIERCRCSVCVCARLRETGRVSE